MFVLEVLANFPYKDVKIRTGESPSTLYDVSAEELGRYDTRLIMLICL